MFEFFMGLASGIALITVVEAFSDWLEAIADRIMVENEERRAKFKNDN